MITPLIQPAELLHLQSQGCVVRIFDCSFDLADPGAGARQFAQTHIAGALHADLDRHLSAQPGAPSASGGRHPLPQRENFAQWLRSTGLNQDEQVVVYDRQGCNYCGRLWWMLRWAGHRAVAVLDGGLQGWIAAGGTVQSGASPVPPSQGNFALKPEQTACVAIETVANRLGHPQQTLIDARGGPRYRGEVEPLDPVAGHIPGALNRPYTENFGPDGRFKPAEQLRAEFSALLAGRDPASVVHHCGSGVSALPNMVAMEIAGMGTTALFAGSWSAWCRDARLPVARG